MDLLFVPKPLFDSEMNVEGYYFSYQYGNAILEAAKSNPLDGAMNSPFIAFMNSVGLEALSQDKTVFVPLTNILLMTDLEKDCLAEPEKVAFLLDRQIDLSDANLLRIRRLKSMGYKIAFRDYADLSALQPFLPYADYVFLPASLKTLRDMQAFIKANYRLISLVVTDIASTQAFDQIKHSGIHLFDGTFYKVHVPSKAIQNALSPLKVNYVQLLNIVNQNDFDFQSFTRIVRQDTALAIAFLRLVNSSSRINAEIKSINHAAAMLGQREIKKWISTAVSTALCTDRPSEITRLSLLRAKFCENMARYFDMAILQESLFLTGLFSVLDVILNQPMEKALEMVFVPETIYKALAYGQGEFSRVLEFALLYEQGDWYSVSRLALIRNIAINDVHDAYVDAMLWYSHLINMPIDNAPISDE